MRSVLGKRPVAVASGGLKPLVLATLEGVGYPRAFCGGGHV